MGDCYSVGHAVSQRKHLMPGKKPHNWAQSKRRDSHKREIVAAADISLLSGAAKIRKKSNQIAASESYWKWQSHFLWTCSGIGKQNREKNRRENCSHTQIVEHTQGLLHKAMLAKLNWGKNLFWSKELVAAEGV